jgi:Tat protein secretion system quality control protein TatD with DNase activity
LPWIAGTVAACRGVSPDQLAEETTSTAERFFGLRA